MTFNEWLNESEGFSLRMERAYDDLVKCPKDPVDNWLQIMTVVHILAFLLLPDFYFYDLVGGNA